MPASSARRGFTLVEVMCGLALVILLVGLFFDLLIPTTRASARATWLMEAQATTTMVLDVLATDIGATASTGMTLPSSVNNPTLTFALHPVARLAPNGSQIWADRAIVYRWDPQSQQLVRKTWPPAPPTLTPALTGDHPFHFQPQDILAVALEPNGTERRLASEITAFSLTPASGPAMPLEIHITMQRQLPDAQLPSVFDIRRRVYSQAP